MRAQFGCKDYKYGIKASNTIAGDRRFDQENGDNT
jgi:hypothetical protein